MPCMFVCARLCLCVGIPSLFLSYIAVLRCLRVCVCGWVRLCNARECMLWSDLRFKFFFVLFECFQEFLAQRPKIYVVYNMYIVYKFSALLCAGEHDMGY